jgi:hypothetical protein
MIAELDEGISAMDVASWGATYLRIVFPDPATNPEGDNQQQPRHKRYKKHTLSMNP